MKEVKLFLRLPPAVIGGMLTASLIAIFSIPVFFYLVEKFSGRKEKAEAAPVDEVGASQAASATK